MAAGYFKIDQSETSGRTTPRRDETAPRLLDCMSLPQMRRLALDVATASPHELADGTEAQTRLCGRFRSLERKGKRRTVVATAVARELSAFIWAINCELMAHRQA